MNEPLIFQPTLMGTLAETPSLFHLFVLKFQTVLATFRPLFKPGLVHEQTNNSSLQNPEDASLSDLARAVSQEKRTQNDHK